MKPKRKYPTRDDYIENIIKIVLYSCNVTDRDALVTWATENVDRLCLADGDYIVEQWERSVNQ